MAIKLNCGAGGVILSKEDGWINIDIRQLDGIDLVLDLENNDFPYEDNSVDEIRLQDFLEHLSKDRQLPFLNEVHRVMKLNGKLFIQLPDLETLSKRYCNVLENPTKLQHPLDAYQLSSALYGGQEYEGNFHKWGYDQYTLSLILEEAGFSIREIGSDGGQNLLCHAQKSPAAFYIMISGGLGDCLQIYFSNPPYCNHEDLKGVNYFPTGQLLASLWLKRLKSFKLKHPNKSVYLIIESHNPSAIRFFDNVPYIEGCISKPWDLPKPWEEDKWSQVHFGLYNLEHSYNPELYEPEEAKVYLSSLEEMQVDTIVNKGDYIIVHPFSGVSRDRQAINQDQYKEIVKKIIKKGLNVVVIGGSYKTNVVGKKYNITEQFDMKCDGLINLVNKSSIAVTVELIHRAKGFIGTHSSMVLMAWYKSLPTVCIVPMYHDGGQPWEEFFADEVNPTTWGNRQPFNKTVMVEDRDIVDLDEIVEWVVK